MRQGVGATGCGEREHSVGIHSCQGSLHSRPAGESLKHRCTVLYSTVLYPLSLLGFCCWFPIPFRRQPRQSTRPVDRHSTVLYIAKTYCHWYLTFVALQCVSVCSYTSQVTATAEYENCAEVARQQNVPLKVSLSSFLLSLRSFLLGLTGFHLCRKPPRESQKLLPESQKLPV